MENWHLRSRGFSLIEVLIVIGILTILICMATLSFGSWVAKYEIERQVCELHTVLQKSEG